MINLNSNKIIAGIDYSMNSPAICIQDQYKLFFYNVNSIHKKYDVFYDSEKFQLNIEYLEKPLNQIERFDILSNKCIEILQKHQVDLMAIEDYSMGSRGKVFHIAENTGILKFKIFKTIQKPLIFFSPKTIKKSATGNGNSNKEKMCLKFLEDTGISFNKIIGCKEFDSPESDLVDSYYIMKHLKDSGLPAF